MKNSGKQQSQYLLIALIIAGWFGINLFYDWHSKGQDLASGYIGSKILLKGEIDHLYSYDKNQYPEQDDELWDQIAEESECGMDVLHPYVQIPLWAGLLQPLVKHLQYPEFTHIFHIIILLSLLGSILLSFKMWAPEFLEPIPLMLFLIIFSLTMPFRYTLFLMQTHPILFFLLILGLYLDHKNKPFIGGMVMAFPIAIKITPIIILFYWMIKKRMRALWGALTGGALLGITSLLLAGWQSHLNFLERIQQISSITLTGYGNHSIRAYLMRTTMTLDSVKQWYMYQTPAWVSVTSTLISILLFSLFFISVYRARKKLDGHYDIIVAQLIILQIITAPIAWMHYFFMLFVPIIIAFKYIRSENSIGAWLLWSITIVGQLFPFAYAKIAYHYTNSNQVILFGLYLGLILYTYFTLKLWFVKEPA